MFLQNTISLCHTCSVHDQSVSLIICVTVSVSCERCGGDNFVYGVVRSGTECV
jgi:hypothetical protein